MVIHLSRQLPMQLNLYLIMFKRHDEYDLGMCRGDKSCKKCHLCKYCNEYCTEVDNKRYLWASVAIALLIICVLCTL